MTYYQVMYLHHDIVWLHTFRFGYVEFESAQQAKKALDTLNGSELDGRGLRLDFAGPRGSGGESGGGRRGGGDRWTPRGGGTPRGGRGGTPRGGRGGQSTSVYSGGRSGVGSVCIWVCVCVWLCESMPCSRSLKLLSFLYLCKNTKSSGRTKCYIKFCSFIHNQTSMWHIHVHIFTCM